MGQETKCLLCNTENAKYEDDFLKERAYFSAPRLQELRIKWNEAITKLHPVLKDFVNNVNTYKVCDLHFKESDIKKSFIDNSINQNTCLLPVSNWVLKLKALPLSSKDLESEKFQNIKKEMSFEEIMVHEDYRDEDVQMSFWSQNNNETNESFLITKTEFENEHDYYKKIDSTLSPYPPVNYDNKGSNREKPQVLKLKKSGGNQVLVLPSSSKVYPLPVSMNNSIQSPVKGPVISNVTSLAKSPVGKFISLNQITSLPGNSGKVIPMKQVPLNPSNPRIKVTSNLLLGSTIPKVSMTPNVLTVSQASTIPKVLTVPKVPTASKFPLVTYGNSSPRIVKEPIIVPSKKNQQINVAVNKNPVPIPLPLSNLEKGIIEPYSKAKLSSELKQYPLPSGWAYKFVEEKILFTQYCTLRRFPVFLSVEEDLTSKISLGHEAVKFIPIEVSLKSFSDLKNSLRRLESLKWCLGIGFGNNNHSDLCLILNKKLNARCKMCSTIRHNAQKRENLEIEQRQKPKNYKSLTRSLKRTNGRLEAKISQLKLMVNHLKNKQCVECLHNRFVKKISVQENSENSVSQTD